MSLVEACRIGDLNAIKILVEEKHENIHANDDWAVQTASRNGHLDAIKYLVSKGANTHTDNELALYWAADEGHLHIVEYLVDQGADIHVQSEAALQAACISGHLHIAKYLISKGANIHNGGDRMLLLVVEFQQVSVVQYLLELGANPHIPNLMCEAIETGNLQVIRLLVQYGTIIPNDFYVSRLYTESHVSSYLYLKCLNPKMICKFLHFHSMVNSFYTFACCFFNDSVFSQVPTLKNNPLFDPNVCLIVSSYCW